MSVWVKCECVMWRASLKWGTLDPRNRCVHSTTHRWDADPRSFSQIIPGSAAFFCADLRPNQVLLKIVQEQKGARCYLPRDQDGVY
jgi:hypothetical protein